jgi:hypothetical protein
MRVLVTTAAVILVALAFSPTPGIAKGPGNSGGSMGGMGQGYHWGVGQTWHGGNDWNHGPNWHPGYQYGGYYVGNPVPYVVQSPVVENPLPVTTFSGGLIKIVNPVGSKTALSYTLNGMPYTIQPGQSQEFAEDRAWVIDFSRGANFGPAHYGLHAGLYSFSISDHGWELYNGVIAPSAAIAAPTNPLPPALHLAE